MRVSIAILISLMLFSQAASGLDSIQVDVRIEADSFDGEEIWVGVFQKGVTASHNSESWMLKSASEFSVSVPVGGENSSVVFLKKNFVPVIVSITPDLLEDGIKLEFSNGISIFGRVTTTTGLPITEGSVSLDSSPILDFSLPDPSLFSWKIEEDGSFEMPGLLPGRYVVTAFAAEFMPAGEEAELVDNEPRHEVNFQLAKATYVTGRILDRYGSSIRGEFDVVITPLESQTTEILTEFDRDDNFHLGPFAEGVTIELTARDGPDHWSRAVEVQSPAEGVHLLMQRWVTLIGTVQNQDTGEPVEEFQIRTGGEGRGAKAFDALAPGGQLELPVDDMTQEVEIMAPGFLWWSTGRYVKLEGRDSIDLGLIDLEPASTVRGRVTDRTTQLPIENVDMRRIDFVDGILSHWNYNNVTATTDAEGEFEITGFPSVNGLLAVSKIGYQDITVPVDDVESYLEIELDSKSGSITGKVVSLDGEPVYPAWVDFGMSGLRNAEDGSFTNVEITGKYKIIAWAESGRSKVLEVTIENGEHISGVELVISEIGRVHGTVQGLEDGESATVLAAKIGEQVEPDGTYQLRGVPIGEHVVNCTTSSGRQLTRIVVLDETLDAQLDFEFEGEFSITGQVAAAGQPFAGLTVQATPDNKNHIRSQASTLRDGTYVIEGLEEGDYSVSVPSRGVSRKVALKGDTQVDFDLGPNELSGHIKALGSVLGVRVTVSGFGNSGKFSLGTTVDAKGLYRFKGLASGSYKVTVQHEKFKKTTRDVEIENSVHDFDFFIHPTELDQLEQEEAQWIEQLGF